MCKKNNNRFDRMGCYTCSTCGKATRETGHDESGMGLCARCLWAQYADGAICDYAPREMAAGYRDRIKECATVESLESLIREITAHNA